MEYEIRRTVEIHPDEIYLKYRVFKNGEDITVIEVGRIFPNINSSKRFIDLLCDELERSGIGCSIGYIGYTTLKIRCDKDREKIKKLHNKIINVIKDTIVKLHCDNKKIDLTNWIWYEWSYKFKI